MKKNQSTLFQTWGMKNKSTSSTTALSVSTKSKKLTAVNNYNGKTKKKSVDDEKDLFDDLDDLIIDDFGNDIELIDQVTRTEKDIFLENNNKINIPYEKISGFDESFGSTYIYPTNYPVRDYQFNIICKALLQNTLVVLPTGLGKTFIAAVVMYNFYRWYPQGKLIFMAPTKPLVAQQIEACYKIMGIPPKDTIEMTGATNPEKREMLWKEKRVFFLTPQVLQNDLSRGACVASQVVCLVFDEAHKALGNHAYCQVLKDIMRHQSCFRVLALSATPGDDMKAVQQVIDNLFISRIEIRSEESIDIKKYVHERSIETIVVPMSSQLKQARAVFIQVLQAILLRLFNKRACWQKDAEKASKFLLLKAREQWRANNAMNDRQSAGFIEGDFAVLISLYHALELLQQHGRLSFYNYLKAILAGTKGTARGRTELRKNESFMQMMEGLHSEIEPDGMNQTLNQSIIAEKDLSTKQRLAKSIPKPLSSFCSHPKLKKLEEVVVNHFKKHQEKSVTASQTPLDTRVMIFSQYRDSVQEISAVLGKHEPLVKAMPFIGQGSKEGATGKNNRGLSQKEQIEILRRFRTGGYNTVISTSVGEEGLDIGDVDLIICFDASNSPIRLVQRMGRTGRKRKGKIVILVGEGKEEMTYKRSVSSKNSIHKHLANSANTLQLYDDNPRMVPKHLNPKCYKMSITVDDEAISKKNPATTSSTITKPIAKKNQAKHRKTNSIEINFRKGLLTSAEHAELRSLYYGDQDGCLRCKRLQNNGDNCNHLDYKYPLSLYEWRDWQTSKQQTVKIKHSKQTENFSSLMSKFDNLKEHTEFERYNKLISSVNFTKQTSIDKISTVKKSKNNNKKDSEGGGRMWRKLQLKMTKPTFTDSDNDDFQVPAPIAVHQVPALIAVHQVPAPITVHQVPASIAVHQVPARITMQKSEEEFLKPCSFEKIFSDVSNSLKKPKSRIRLTKLPTVPQKDLPIINDIEDNQLDFCSQISMDTLYNRCQKKRNSEQLHFLLEEDETEDVDQKEYSDQSEKNKENFDASYNSVEKYKPSDEVLFDNEIPENIKHSILENIELTPEYDKHLTEDSQGLFPMSTPTRTLQLRKTTPKVCIVTPIMKDDVIATKSNIPEPPLDIDLSSFLQNDFSFMENNKSKNLQSNINNSKDDIDIFDKRKFTNVKNKDIFAGDSLLDLIENDDDDFLSSPPVISQAPIQTKFQTNIRTNNNHCEGDDIEKIKTKEEESLSKLLQDGDSPLFRKPKLSMKQKVGVINDSNFSLCDDNVTVLEDSPLFRKPKLSIKRKMGVMDDSNFSLCDDDVIVSNATKCESIERQPLNLKRRRISRNKITRERAKKFSAARQFLDIEAEDGEMEVSMYENEAGLSYVDGYVKDSFIDDASQESPCVKKRKKFKNPETPVDMNAVYKRSLMSPNFDTLRFQTPAFKAGRNRYKLVDLAEKYKNLNSDESSEAEEVMGLVESDVDQTFSNEEEGITLNEENISSEDSEVAEEESTLAESPKDRVKTSKKRVRAFNDSDDSASEEKDGFGEVKDINNEDHKKINRCGLKSWCKTYTIDNLPPINFSFGIIWKSPIKNKTSNIVTSKPLPNNISSIQAESKRGCNPVKPILSSKHYILIDSRCMANSQIASLLRANFKCEMKVLQQLGCDYVISQRCGVNRKTVSDMSNGGNMQKIVESVQTLCELFVKPYFIIEKDRVKAKQIQPKTSQLSKYYAGILAKLSLANVTLLFSSSQEETSSLLGKLLKFETEQGYTVRKFNENNTTSIQKQMLTSLLTIPNVTYPVAMEIIHNYRNIGEVMKTSLSDFTSKLKFLQSQKCAEIYFFFQRRFDISMLGAKKIQ